MSLQSSVSEYLFRCVNAEFCFRVSISLRQCRVQFQSIYLTASVQSSVSEYLFHSVTAEFSFRVSISLRHSRVQFQSIYFTVSLQSTASKYLFHCVTEELGYRVPISVGHCMQSSVSEYPFHCVTAELSFRVSISRRHFRAQFQSIHFTASVQSSVSEYPFLCVTADSFKMQHYSDANKLNWIILNGLKVSHFFRILHHETTTSFHRLIINTYIINLSILHTWNYM